MQYVMTKQNDRCGLTHITDASSSYFLYLYTIIFSLLISDNLHTYRSGLFHYVLEKVLIDDAVLHSFPSTSHMAHLPTNNSKLEDETTEELQITAAMSLHEDF